MAKIKSNLFGNKRRFEKWYGNLTDLDKKLILGYLGLIVGVLLIMTTISMIRTYDNDISPQQCNLLTNIAVRDALSIQEQNSVLAFMYAFENMFILIIVAIAISWIVHGVGFRVVSV